MYRLRALYLYSVIFFFPMYRLDAPYRKPDRFTQWLGDHFLTPYSEACRYPTSASPPTDNDWFVVV